MALYPLKFNPLLKDRLWGGSRLAELLGKEAISETTGESWEVSGVNGDESVVANGALKGLTIRQLIDRYAENLLGTSVVARFGHEFPVLIKYIDAEKELSVQLHPDDALARSRHNSFGKTEMWYIMAAAPGSELIIGFNRDLNADEYKTHLEDGSLMELLQQVPVNAGDSFFIPAGKVHAIGAGILLAEIQQTSDVTYRIYDYERKDSEGNYRELHTDLALDAIDYEKKDDFVIDYSRDANRQNPMVNTPYFKTNYLNLSSNLKLAVAPRESFTVLMCVGGEARVENEVGSADLKYGETVLLPASSEFIEIRSRKAELLEVTI